MKSLLERPGGQFNSIDQSKSALLETSCIDLEAYEYCDPSLYNTDNRVGF